MSTRLPFTKIAHHPNKPELVLANGHYYVVLNTSNGEIIKSYPQDAKIDNVTDYYRSMQFNKDGSLFATSGENKELCVWDTNNWSLKFSRPAYKRVNAMAFNKDSTQLLSADKFGDVYCHPVKEAIEGEEKLQPIVGHVSMVTDMLLTPDDKYVITSDRDEHIRVSRFPNGYNIESFCLGHTDVVTCIDILPWDESILVSSGGDSTVRTWDFKNGISKQTLDLKSKIEAYKPPAADANSEDAIVSALAFNINTKTLAVSFAKSTAVLILNWEDDTGFAYSETKLAPLPILDIAYDLEGKLWMSLDGDKLVHVCSSTSSENLLKQINTAEVCKANEVFDLYTIFGLRKFLDLPERVSNEENASNKKRKTK
ncbi:hypothetical protein [Parasitella parasitica]|uniref:Uncharacterized protein n=1 Tax=Parasitella parasitica TaxID=35722 RepID=A0A0B7MM76_9FUNG|nr:hypothetical protein [Parasitella parasitica]